jgi:hypothetical protein
MSTKKVREPKLDPLLKIEHIVREGMKKEVKIETKPTR